MFWSNRNNERDPSLSRDGKTWPATIFYRERDWLRVWTWDTIGHSLRREKTLKKKTNSLLVAMEICDRLRSLSTRGTKAVCAQLVQFNLNCRPFIRKLPRFLPSSFDKRPIYAFTTRFTVRMWPFSQGRSRSLRCRQKESFLSLLSCLYPQCTAKHQIKLPATDVSNEMFAFWFLESH